MGGIFSKPTPPTPSPPSTLPTRLRAAGLTVLTPTDAAYTDRQASYWSNSASSLSPSCIVQPTSASEVSTALLALISSGSKFAVRSGGHTQWAGAANIDGGVTLDLGLLSWTRYNASTETVEIGPGGKWRDVYAALAGYERAVAGGREGNVGVAGLLLGGGNTFYTARYGFACDNVVGYEVVLADGRVVNATRDGEEEMRDLFWALKGGGGANFGIVTNFTMRALESGQVWGGLTFYPKQVTQMAAEALVDFTEGIREDVDSNILCFFAYTPQFKDVGIATFSVQIAGVENPPAYEKWSKIPSIVDMRATTTVTELVSAPQNNLPTDYYDIWFTSTFKNDVRIVQKAAELHEALVEELKPLIPDGDFWTQCLFQPLPKLFAERSVAAGGNAMGVERAGTDGLLFQAAAMVRTPEQEALVYPKIQALIAAVREFAATIDGGLLEWTYLNYADKSQDPFTSYGKENVKRLKEIALKYDPEQVFQRLCPGGFKISQAKSD